MYVDLFHFPRCSLRINSIFNQSIFAPCRVTVGGFLGPKRSAQVPVELVVSKGAHAARFFLDKKLRTATVDDIKFDLFTTSFSRPMRTSLLGIETMPNQSSRALISCGELLAKSGKF